MWSALAKLSIRNKCYKKYSIMISFLTKCQTYLKQ